MRVVNFVVSMLGARLQKYTFNLNTFIYADAILLAALTTAELDVLVPIALASDDLLDNFPDNVYKEWKSCY